MSTSNYMLVTLSIRQYFERSNNLFGADNQQERLVARQESPETKR
jgi:hypothetical protein